MEDTRRRATWPLTRLPSIPRLQRCLVRTRVRSLARSTPQLRGTAAFWSIPMRAGQRIITHDHDYGANWVAFLRAVEVRGVKIDQIPSDPDGQIDLDRLAAALARPDEVAVVSLAWIPTSGGLVNPRRSSWRTHRAGLCGRSCSTHARPSARSTLTLLRLDVTSSPQPAASFSVVRAAPDFSMPAIQSSSGSRQRSPDHHGAEWVALDRYEFVDGARRFEYWEFDHAALAGAGGGSRSRNRTRYRADREHHQATCRGASIGIAGGSGYGCTTKGSIGVALSQRRTRRRRHQRLRRCSQPSRSTYRRHTSIRRAPTWRVEGCCRWCGFRFTARRPLQRSNERSTSCEHSEPAALPAGVWLGSRAGLVSDKWVFRRRIGQGINAVFPSACTCRRPRLRSPRSCGLQPRPASG